MCYGYDGETALRRSLETQGASRRGILRTAVAGAAGAAAIGALGAPAEAAGTRGSGNGRDREVPERRISIQLYTLRDATLPAGTAEKPWSIGWEAVLERLAQYGYPRVERAGLYGVTAATMKAKLDSLGIWASSSHEGISDTSAAMYQKFDDANTFEQRYVVVPYLNSDKLSDWQRWAEQMNNEAYAAKRRGLRYGYHNHAHEFAQVLDDGSRPWEILTSRLDRKLVHLEVDLYWAVTGGRITGESDPVQFAIDVIEDAPQRTRQFHVKDKRFETFPPSPTPWWEGDMADLGTGGIDFPRIFAAHRVAEYIVENDNPDISPLVTAQTGIDYLQHVRY